MKILSLGVVAVSAQASVWQFTHLHQTKCLNKICGITKNYLTDYWLWAMTRDNQYNVLSPHNENLKRILTWIHYKTNLQCIQRLIHRNWHANFGQVFANVLAQKAPHTDIWFYPRYGELWTASYLKLAKMFPTIFLSCNVNIENNLLITNLRQFVFKNFD